jgi:hypothetical protein
LGLGLFWSVCPISCHTKAVDYFRHSLVEALSALPGDQVRSCHVMWYHLSTVQIHQSFPRINAVRTVMISILCFPILWPALDQKNHWWNSTKPCEFTPNLPCSRNVCLSSRPATLTRPELRIPRRARSESYGFNLMPPNREPSA